jgi:hypothetical protein
LQVDFIFTPWRKQAKTSFRKYSFFSEEVLYNYGSIGVNNNICTASSINTRPPDDAVSLVQGQIFVASHSINCSFVLFPCTRMLVFKIELAHEITEVITRPFTQFHGVNGDGELA